MALPVPLKGAPPRGRFISNPRVRLLLGIAAMLLLILVAAVSPKPAATPALDEDQQRPSILAGERFLSPSGRAAALSPALHTTDRSGGAAMPAPARVDPGLVRVLDGATARYQGSLGVVVKQLRTGATATLNAEQRFRSASLYKLFVLYSAFDGIERGSLSRDEMLTLSPQAAKSDPYAEWPVGTRATLADALKAMIVVSSNSATDMLIERLGGEERINTRIWELGLQQSGFGGNYAYTTPADLALLLEAMASHQAVSPAASEEMLQLLKSQTRNDRFPLPLPLGVEVAHKTGELTRLRNDAGIVYAPSGPYLFVVLADGARNDAAARQVHLDLSRNVYAYFEPRGLTQYLGLHPRLAAEVFRTFDSGGRLMPLDDEWGETVSVSPAAVDLAEGIKSVNLREMVVPHLVSMQKAADESGARLWVNAGYRAPSETDAPMVAKLPLPFHIELPPRKAPADPPTGQQAPKAPSTPPAASQHWLGTVVGLSDSREGKPAEPGYNSSAAGRWLLGHAWEYGFVLVPAETPEGKALGYEPWKLRWVGRGMAERLHDLGYERDPTAIATRELERAERELSDPSLWKDIERPLLFDP